MTSLWKNYDAKSSYDEYLTPERKLRKEAKIISSILDRHGKKKLQEIDRNCMSTIDSRGINFKVYSADSEGRTYVRCWINPPEKVWYNSVILENSWNEGECNWFFTHCNGAYNLEEWHELLEQLRPVQNWIYQLKEETSNKRKLCNLLN